MIDRTVWFEWLDMDFSDNPDDPLQLLCLPANFFVFSDSTQTPSSSSAHPLASILSSESVHSSESTSDHEDHSSEISKKLAQLRRAAVQRRLAIRKIRPGEHREAWKWLLAAIDEAEQTLAQRLQTMAHLSSISSDSADLSRFNGGDPSDDVSSSNEAVIGPQTGSKCDPQNITTIPSRSFRILEDDETVSDVPYEAPIDRPPPCPLSSSVSDLSDLPNIPPPNAFKEVDLRNVSVRMPVSPTPAFPLATSIPISSATSTFSSVTATPIPLTTPTSAFPTPDISTIITESVSTPPKISRRKFVWGARLCMLLLLAGMTCGALWYRERLQSSVSSELSSSELLEASNRSIVGDDAAACVAPKTTSVAQSGPTEAKVALDQELSQIPTLNVHTVQATNTKKSETSDNLSPVISESPSPSATKQTSSSSNKPRTWEFATDDEERETSGDATLTTETLDATIGLDTELRTIREWMRERKYTEAATRLDTLARSATNQDVYDRIDRLRFWNKNLQSFWTTVHEIAGRLKPMDELPVRGTVILVVSSSKDELVLRVDGTRKVYPPYSYPQIVVNALVLSGFDKSDDSLFLTASFLAADTRGEPDTARSILLSLQKKGYAPATELLQALDDPYNAEADK